MIEIKNIYKSFGKFEVLKNFSCAFNSGKIIAVVGPNASGKTTLIKCILGMVLPDKGEILIDNNSVLNQFQYRENIGYMPQIGRFPDYMKISQVIDLIKNIREKKSENNFDEELIHLFELDKTGNKLMRNLSGGTRQKVSAALAFLFHPALYILDEPTAGLDPVATEILKQKIISKRSEGKLVIITSHIMSEVDELADDILYIQDGENKFFKSVYDIKNETGESKLGKAMATLISKNYHD